MKIIGKHITPNWLFLSTIATFLLLFMSINKSFSNDSVPVLPSVDDQKNRHICHTQKVPGVIIVHSPASSGKYIGSPSIAILPNGTYIASHDFFGPEAEYRTAPVTTIYRSLNRGQTWDKVSEIKPLFWNKLFVHQEKLYSLGMQHEYGNVLMRCSEDGGKTWTIPDSPANGLLKKGTYHCAPCPVVLHNNRIWRSLELAEGNRPEWSAIVISAPINSDLLNGNNWTFSQPLQHRWSESQWIEGNIVVTPAKKLVNILRTNGNGNDKAVITHVSEDGLTLLHNGEEDTIAFPGGGVKFTIHFDPRTSRYWSIVNQQKETDAGRNNLVLTSSQDLQNWGIEFLLYSHPDKFQHAWQYVDWLIENEDIIFVSRTAFDDGLGGAHNDHDANYLTFHRIKNFRFPKNRELTTN